MPSWTVPVTAAQWHHWIRNSLAASTLPSGKRGGLVVSTPFLEGGIFIRKVKC